MTTPPSSNETDRSPVPDYRTLYSLAGRVMVVLGGGNGIGRQTCHALAQAGTKVVCVDRDETRASAVAREVDGVAHAADVTKRGEVELVFAAARQHGAVLFVFQAEDGIRVYKVTGVQTSALPI